MPHALLVESPDPRLELAARRALRRMPPFCGAPIRIVAAPGLRDLRGAVHAGAFIPERRIALDCSAREFGRILAHELFHFVWVRLGNPRRRRWEEALRGELARGARGELGWSAEWRKRALTPRDAALRTRRWREYCCESFCDTAAWLYGGRARHAEFTLAARFGAARRVWFEREAGHGLSI
jgi:hypothetical protein